MGHFIVVRLFLLFILLPALLLAQPEKGQNWGVSLTPAVVPSPSFNYALQPGVEYRISQKFFLLTEFAFVPHYPKNNHAVSDRKYFRIKPELRYILPAKKRKLQQYFALQLSYAFRTFKDADGGYYLEGRGLDTVATFFTEASVHSPISTATLQSGIDFLIAHDVYIELFTGMGVRNINTRYNNIINPRLGPYALPKDKIFPAPDPAYEFNRSLYRFQWNIGIRLLYRFRNN